MSTASKKSLKRLSLLQSPISVSSPSSSGFGSPDAAPRRVDFSDDLGNFAVQHSPVSTILVSSPTTNARSSNATKTARRQSSIFYVSQDRDVERVAKDARSPADDRRFSAPQIQDVHNSVVLEKENKRRSMNGGGEQSAPMTLAEKHADLLRFIAQKESRCLELRSQLASEEADLLALKRKWERIVSRGLTRQPSASSSSVDNDYPSQVTMLSGIKEGVQGVTRLLAQLGELGVQSNELEQGHASNSSISTTLTSSSSTRLSQSSMSSLAISEDDDPTEHENVSLDSPDRSSKRHSLSTAIRRRPYEPSSPSTPPPPILTPRTPLSASFMHGQASPPTLSRSKSTTSSQSRSKHAKRLSTVTATDSFPPASSIPGVSGAPFASLMDSLGRSFRQQNTVGQARQGSESGSRASAGHQKRASTLFSDASKSFFSALTSPTCPSPISGGMLPSSPSLLDDDDTLGDGSEVQWPNMAALSPERPKIAHAPGGASQAELAGNVGGASARASDSDSEEWNW